MATEHTADHVIPAITPSERFFVPHRKRMLCSYATNAEGVRELRLDYGLREVTFDEEHLFPFGEQLVREPSFTGEMATQWGPGYEWDEIRPLLEALLDEGIIRRGEGVDDPRGGGLVPGMLKPSVCPVHRSWSAGETEAISRDLGGHAVEIGYLESVVPLFRIAHPAMDADDRQVGEANVYPARLRLDRDTEWRVCQYAGSRYRDEGPMNVTALRAMIKHWKPMMATLGVVRDELRKRLDLPQGNWTVGDLHLLSCVVLGVPTYQLMKRGGSTPQPPLHPVLSSLFRITDGVRMTTYSMLFSIEDTHSAEERIGARDFHAFVESSGLFIGDTGVCAGPRPMVEEFLSIAVDGQPFEYAEPLPDQVQAVVDEIPSVLEYSFYAMQSWAVSLSVWLDMSVAHQQIMDLFERPAPNPSPKFDRLRGRLRAGRKILDFMQIVQQYDRDVHLKAYQDGYERSWRASRVRVGPEKLADAIAVAADGPEMQAFTAQLRSLLSARIAPGELADVDGVSAVDRLTEIYVTYLRHEQAVLKTTLVLQEAINQVLERERPKRALTVEDFRTNYSIGSGVGSFPYVIELLDQELGIHVDCTADRIAVSEVASRKAS